jgi:hypothetical protein
MKYLLIILILASFNSFAIDLSLVDQNHPGFHDYESMSLTGVRDYFRKLLNKSVQYSQKDNFYFFDVKNGEWDSVAKMSVQIERMITGDTIVERVKYQIVNGSGFDYILTRKGSNIKPLKNEDLLLFKFQLDDSTTFYDLTIPTFSVEFQKELKGTEEKSFFLLTIFGVNVAVNSSYKENEINRDYIYFFKGMNPPQQQLTVNVKDNGDTWGTYQYLYYSRGSGLIEPKFFFKALNDGSNMFNEASAMFVSILNGLGFPKIE